jgi:amino acid adenylation domain-containing protein
MERSQKKLELLEHLLREEGIEPAARQTIPRRQNPEDLPLSHAQRRLWFLNYLEPGPHYNDHFNLRLQGSLDLPALRRSLNEIVRRHEALRAVIVAEEGRPVQRIVPPFQLPVPLTDLAPLPESERNEQARRLAVDMAREPFNLQTGPLLRAGLLRLTEQDHILCLAMHHIAIDGWSRGVFLKELSLLYPEFAAGREPALADLPIQYADFAAWQQQWMDSKEQQEQLTYWKRQLAGAPELLPWPTSFPRPELQSFRGARESLIIPKPLANALNDLSRREGCTLFMTLLAAFQALAARYTGQEDIVIGSPIANRNRTEIEGIIGCFVNTLALRTNLSGDPTFRELLERTKESALGAYAHQDLPFESLVEKLHPARAPNYGPIFQMVFILQNTPETARQVGGLSISPFEIDSGTAKMDLTVNLAETPDGICGWIEYATDLFSPGAVARLRGHYLTLLQGVAADPDQRVSSLPLLTENENQQLLHEWNGPRIDYPRGRCVHEIFEEQAGRAPDAPALAFEGRELTYSELDECANRLAWRLRESGVGPDTLVAICAQRSLEMIVGLLAILKAGGAYVALDPNYPQERLAFMLEDTEASVLLAQRHLASGLPPHDAKVILLGPEDAEPHPEMAPEKSANPRSGVTTKNLVNVVYTSGSTGRPKGTLLEHRGLVRMATSAWQAGFRPDDVFFQYAPISFDASSWEIWIPLLNGAKLAMMSPGTSSLEALGEAIRRHNVTILLLTTGLFRMMVDERLQDLKGLRQFWAAGDVLPVAIAATALRELPNCSVFNAYGPTENSTMTTWHRVSEGDLAANSIPIGRPIADCDVYILDQNMKLVPAGVPGEMYIGGEGLARGYLKQPGLTAAKFVRNPFSREAEARLYRTGDLCRHLEDGAIEFLGRLDQQVKIRGFRMELEEIENLMREHPAIREAVVVAREDAPGGKTLAAYFVPKQTGKCPPEEVRAYLKTRLPGHMVPAACIMLESFPLSPNGKVDRKALPAPERDRPELASNYAAPRTPTEKMLADAWTRALRLERIGINDNFFDLGAHSLLLMQLHARLDEAIRSRLPIVKFFRFPTIRSLAAHLDQPAGEAGVMQTIRSRVRLQQEALSRQRAAKLVKA